VGDPVYGGRRRLPPAAGPELIEKLTSFRRQALHAARLKLMHPLTDRPMEWESPLPADMRDLLSVLQSGTEQGARD
jgi:23S rRNA pseudouridine1911/1915/1917 synthase